MKKIKFWTQEEKVAFDEKMKMIIEDKKTLKQKTFDAIIHTFITPLALMAWWWMSGYHHVAPKTSALIFQYFAMSGEDVHEYLKSGNIFPFSNSYKFTQVK